MGIVKDLNYPVKQYLVDIRKLIIEGFEIVG